ncbi:unnamed protein product [Arabis nemorensis]|uniref:Uncharacterized protein n=1 Tax=Arabis nemorensis TaxID=586526 RepID=A0A565ASS7_9BRAS|nr:unnamed protein product [Arabis nemorensis]
MSTKGDDSSSKVDREVKKEPASVIPVKRKLVKTRAAKTIISALTSSGCSRSSESTGDGKGARVYPTRT